jgi:hypothetical protein
MSRGGLVQRVAGSNCPIAKSVTAADDVTVPVVVPAWMFPPDAG